MPFKNTVFWNIQNDTALDKMQKAYWVQCIRQFWAIWIRIAASRATTLHFKFSNCLRSRIEHSIATRSIKWIGSWRQTAPNIEDLCCRVEKSLLFIKAGVSFVRRETGEVIIQFHRPRKNYLINAVSSICMEGGTWELGKAVFSLLSRYMYVLLCWCWLCDCRNVVQGYMYGSSFSCML